MKYYVRESATARIHGTYTQEELAAKITSGELARASEAHLSQGQTEGALRRSMQWIPLVSLVEPSVGADVGPATESVEDVEGERVEIRCPACSERVLATAKKCKHCGEWIARATQSVPSPIRESDAIGSPLKAIGIVMLVVGLVWAFYSMSLDPSVATGEYGQRVNNLGLMNDKQNYLIIGGVVAIIGAGLLAAGTLASSSTKRE